MTDQKLFQPYFFFGIFAFLFNFFWEAWHAVYFYEGFGDESGTLVHSYRGFVSLMSSVAVVDAAILLLILAGGIVLWRRVDWFLTMNFAQYAYFLGVSVVWAGLIEYKAVFLLHQWSYTSVMPTLFGLGLSPLLQLATTGACSLALARRLRLP